MPINHNQRDSDSDFYCRKMSGRGGEPRSEQAKKFYFFNKQLTQRHKHCEGAERSGAKITAG
jgi:hypothetical protein